jgi:hypothetical protein
VPPNRFRFSCAARFFAASSVAAALMRLAWRRSSGTDPFLAVANSFGSAAGSCAAAAATSRA